MSEPPVVKPPNRQFWAALIAAAIVAVLLAIFLMRKIRMAAPPEAPVQTNNLTVPVPR